MSASGLAGAPERNGPRMSECLLHSLIADTKCLVGVRGHESQSQASKSLSCPSEALTWTLATLFPIFVHGVQTLAGTGRNKSQATQVQRPNRGVTPERPSEGLTFGKSSLRVGRTSLGRSGEYMIVHGEAKEAYQSALNLQSFKHSEASADSRSGLE